MRKFVTGYLVSGVSIIIILVLFTWHFDTTIKSFGNNISSCGTDIVNASNDTSEMKTSIPTFFDYVDANNYVPVGGDTFDKWFNEGKFDGSYVKYYNYSTADYRYLFDVDKLNKILSKLVTDGKVLKKK